ncbi:response regulator transcription factor [Metaclostridioides mangenotii]|uniref:response regulator transcription factor n=1 Tax=Metaclostridioides mangenotii TaxID=1540 RepID=UPI000486ADB6|nr:response regulator transcription factor [Clostridioides mangenotii]
MRILLVEDEVQLSEALKQILIKNKYSVDTVFNGEDGLHYGLTDMFDVIILDIMLPKLNGIQVLKMLRNKKISTPIILLTAKGSVEDKILGLDSGADDYLPKPFSTEELLARIRSVTRRNGDFINENVLEFSDIRLNLSTYEMEVGNNSITLTLKEFDILKYFMQRPKAVVSKDDLISKVWGFDSDAEHNNIEVYISFLRKKLSYVESNVKITTIRRVGYRLE